MNPVPFRYSKHINMKTCLKYFILLLIFILSHTLSAQDQLYANISGGMELSTEQAVASLGLEYYVTERFTVGSNFTRFPELTTGSLHLGYDVISMGNYSLSLKAGGTYQGKALVSIVNYLQLKEGMFLSLGTTSIRDNVNFNIINLGISINVVNFGKRNNFK